jgi:hypothetical protein
MLYDVSSKIGFDLEKRLVSAVTVPAIVCVPVGFAVTVPAIVTVLPTVTDAIETGWVDGKLEIETAEKVTACDAGKFKTDTLPVTAPKVTACEAGKLPTVTVPPTVTALALNCTSVRPPVTVTCPMVTVMLSSALSDVGPSSTVPVTVLLVA